AGFDDAIPGLMSRTICGFSDSVIRSSSTSRPRASRRRRARETGAAWWEVRSVLDQRSKDGSFMESFSVHGYEHISHLLSSFPGAADHPPRRLLVSRLPRRGRRLRHRPDRCGAVEAGVRPGQRWAAGTWHDLDVEDFFDACHELEMGHQSVRAEIHDTDTALEVRPPLGDRHAAERR